MTTENKQIAMYFGGAVLIGAVGYFVYSFFQKKTVTIPSYLPTNPATTPSDFSNVFKTMESTQFEPIAKPSLIA